MSRLNFDDKWYIAETILLEICEHHNFKTDKIRIWYSKKTDTFYWLDRIEKKNKKPKVWFKKDGKSF